MKHKHITHILTLLLTAAVSCALFIGCPNLNANTQTPAIGTIKVAISLGEGIYDDDFSARAAVPSGFPHEDDTKFVFAGAIHDATETVTGDKLLAGTYSYDSATGTSSVEIIFTLSDDDRTGYTLTIYAFPNGTTINSSTSLDSALLVGSTGISIPSNSPNATLSESTVKMRAYSANTSATGFVNLSIVIPTGYTLACSDTTNFYCTGSGENYSFKNVWSKPSIPAKAYTVDFYLQKQYGTYPDITSTTFFAWTETINVLPGLTTDKWTQSVVGTVSADGKTKTISDVTIYRTFYVCGTPESGEHSDSWFAQFEAAGGEITGDDDNGTGSLAKPFKTVQKAVDKVLLMNGGIAEESYTIFVDGEVAASSDGTVVNFTSIGSTSAKISIIGVNSKSKATLKGNLTSSLGNKNSVIIIPESTSLNLTLDNLMITGGTSTSGGAGIRIGSGTITVNNCELSYNMASDSDGGGIYNNGGTVSITDSTISGNTADNGGAIYNNGTLTITGGTISGNTATNLGNGITNGGILEMSGNVQVSENNEIYLESGKYITISGSLSQSTVARISLDTGDATATPAVPSQYSKGTIVLQAATTGANGTAISESTQKSLISSNVGKFILNEPNDQTATNKTFYIKADGTKAILAKYAVSSSVELPKEKYTIVLHKADGTASGVELGAEDTVSVGDEITFTVKDSSGADVTDSVTSYAITAKHNGNDISSAFSGMITDSTGTDISTAKIKIPYKLAKTKADIECHVSVKINGVKYNSSSTVKMADKMTVSVANFADYLTAVVALGETNPSIKVNVSNTSELTGIRNQINSLPDGTKIDLEICGVGTSGVEIGTELFKSNVKINAVILSGNVTKIGRMSFVNSSLTSITIPASVTDIDGTAFQECSSFTSITVDENNPNFCSVDGVLFSKDKTELLCYPAGKTGTTYKIPETVTTIGTGAFLGNSHITTMEIPSNVTRLKTEAFRVCEHLSELTFADTEGWTLNGTPTDVTDSATNVEMCTVQSVNWNQYDLVKTVSP